MIERMFYIGEIDFLVKNVEEEKDKLFGKHTLKKCSVNSQ